MVTGPVPPVCDVKAEREPYADLDDGQVLSLATAAWRESQALGRVAGDEAYRRYTLHMLELGRRATDHATALIRARDEGLSL